MEKDRCAVRGAKGHNRHNDGVTYKGKHVCGSCWDWLGNLPGTEIATIIGVKR